MVFQQTIPTLPLFQGSLDVVQFATELYQFQQDNARQHRVYNDRQLSIHYLATLTACDYPLHVQYTQLMDLPPDVQLPHSLHFRTIALAMARRDATAGSRLTPGPAHQTLLPLTATAHRLVPTTPRASAPSRRSAPTELSAASGPFRLREDTQCTACGTWGHQMSRCSQLAKHTLLTQFSASHSSDANRAAAAWKLLHSASNHPAAVSRRLVQSPNATSGYTLFDVIYDADTPSTDRESPPPNGDLVSDAPGDSFLSDFHSPG